MLKNSMIAIALMLALCQFANAQNKKKPRQPLENGEAIELDEAIPANERGILCLASDGKGKIYGGTTGRAAHLFVYDAKKDKVRSLVRLPGGIGFSYALIRLPDGSLIAGTQADPTKIAVKTDAKAVGWLYRFVVKNGKAKVEKLGKPVAGQGIYTLAFDKKTHTIFGNTWPDGHFFTYDLKTRKFKDHGAIAGYRPYETPKHAEELNRGTKRKLRFARQVSRAIIVVPGTGALTGGKDGWLYKYDLKTNKIGKTKARLPAVRGREAWASLETVVRHSEAEKEFQLFDNRHHIGITADGYLADILVTADGKVRAMTCGRPYRQGGHYILTKSAGDGRQSVGDLVGVTGAQEGIPRVFTYSELPGSTVELGGIPTVDGQLSMVGFGAMIRSDDDTIYAGEKDRIGRLIRYSTSEAPKKKKATARPKSAPKNLPGPPPEENLKKLKCRIVFAPEGTTTDGSGYTALAVSKDNKVYVGAARYGGYAWLLRFDMKNAGLFMDKLVHVLRLVGERLVGIFTQAKIHAMIVIAPDGKVWFATKRGHEIFGTRPEFEDPVGYPGGHLCYYDPKTGFSRSVGILKRHQGLMGGVLDVKRNRLYYCTAPHNILISYDIKTGAVKEYGHVGNHLRYMVIDKNGAVYMGARGNYLCRFDPETGYIEDLKVKVEGPGYYETPYVIALGPNGKLYGAGIRHPWIMEFDIAHYKKGLFPEVTMRNVAPAAPRGLPVQDIHAATFGKDGKFYYPLVTTGPTEKGGKAKRHLRIMRFDPVKGKTETVGIPDVQLDESKVKHAYVRGDKYALDHIQGAKAGPDGTLYLMDIYPQLNVAMFPQLTAARK